MNLRFWKKPEDHLSPFHYLKKEKTPTEVKLHEYIIIPIATWIAEAIMWIGETIGIEIPWETAFAIGKTITYIAIGAVCSVASSLISGWLANKPSSGSVTSNGRLFNTKSPTDPIAIVYGECKVGGNWVFTDPSTMQNRELSAAVTFAEGEVEGIAYDIDEKPDFFNSPLDTLKEGLNDMLTGGLYVPPTIADTELLTNNNFESWASATDLNDWTEVLSGSTTVNRESSVVYNGTYSVRITTVSGAEGYIRQMNTVNPGKKYTLSVYYRHSTNGSNVRKIRISYLNSRFLREDGSWASSTYFINLPRSTSWTQFSVSFYAPPETSSSIWVDFYSNSGSENAYFDLASLKQVSEHTRYRVEIDGDSSPNTFKWTDQGEKSSPTWNATGVAITAGWQTLNNGVKIKFRNTVNHYLNSFWIFNAGLGIWVGEKLIYYQMAYGITPAIGLADQCYANFYFHNGSPTQIVDVALNYIEPSFDDAMRNTCWGSFRLKWSDYLWNSIPEFRLTLKGLKIYDPRTSTTVYSRNPALVWLDMMTNKRYGMGIDISRIDTNSVEDAANWCDANGYYFDGAFIDRMAFIDHMEDLLNNFRAYVNRSFGIYSLHIYTDDAAVMNLTDKDFELDKGIEIDQPGIPETPNKIKTIYVDRVKHNSVAYAEYYEQAVISAAITEQLQEVALIGTSTYAQAKKLSKYYYMRSKYGKMYNMICHPRTIALSTGDMVNITSEYLEWTNNKVRVSRIGIPQDGLIPIVFMEENSAIYDQTVDIVDESEQIIYSPAGDKTADAPGGLVVGDTGYDEVTFNKADTYQNLYWDCPGNGVDYILTYRKPTDTYWTSITIKDPLDTSGLVTYRIGGLPTNTTYEWKVRQVIGNSQSEWTSGTNFTTYNPDAPIASGVILTATNKSDSVLLSWSFSGLENPNVFYWNIYRGLTSTFANATLIDQVAAAIRSYSDLQVIVNKTYYYWLLPVDRLNQVAASPSNYVTLVHYHTQLAPQLTQIDPSAAPTNEGTIVLSTNAGDTIPLHNCDSTTGWTSDSAVAGSIDVSLETTDVKEGTGAIKIFANRYAHKYSFDGGDGTGFNVGTYARWFGQIVKPDSSFTMTALGIKITKVGSPSDLVISIYADSGGHPTGSALATETLAASSVPTSLSPAPKNYTYVVFSPTLALTSGTIYHVVFDTQTTSYTNYYKIYGNQGYSTGFGSADEHMEYSLNGTNWIDYPIFDFNFRLCVNGDALNKRVYVDIGTAQDISAKTYFKVWAKGSRTGTNFQIAFAEQSAGVPSGWQDFDVTIAVASAWEFQAKDISAIGSTSRDAVKYVGVEITNMDDDILIVLDQIFSNISYPTPKIYLDGEWKEFQLVGGGSSGPSSYSEFLDDFVRIPATWDWNLSTGTKTDQAARNGVVRLTGDGGNTLVVYPYTQNTLLPYIYNKGPEFTIRIAPYGTSGSVTRYIGFCAATGTPPTNGIYFRFTTGNNFFGVCRASSTESTQDMGVASANGVYHTLKLVVASDGSSVEFFIDDVSKGTISTNIPTGALFFFIATSSTSTSEGIDVDFVYIKQSR